MGGCRWVGGWVGGWVGRTLSVALLSSMTKGSWREKALWTCLNEKEGGWVGN